MLPGLVDEGCREKLRRIELAHSEAVEPRFASTARALDPHPVRIPLAGLDSVRSTLTKEQVRHEDGSVDGKAKKRLM
jgi:hypothetical protein